MECDSWAYHAEKSAFGRDLERHNELAVVGRVLPFSREQATSRPDRVRMVMQRASVARSA